MVAQQSHQREYRQNRPRCRPSHTKCQGKQEPRRGSSAVADRACLSSQTSLKHSERSSAIADELGRSCCRVANIASGTDRGPAVPSRSIGEFVRDPIATVARSGKTLRSVPEWIERPVPPQQRDTSISGQCQTSRVILRALSSRCRLRTIPRMRQRNTFLVPGGGSQEGRFHGLCA